MIVTVVSFDNVQNLCVGWLMMCIMLSLILHARLHEKQSCFHCAYHVSRHVALPCLGMHTLGEGLQLARQQHLQGLFEFP